MSSLKRLLRSVREVANTARLNQMNSQSLPGIQTTLSNHMSTNNANAHLIQNISGLSTALNGKEPIIVNKSASFNKDFGSAAGTICEGNDPRLSNSRHPLQHFHELSDIPQISQELNKKANVFSGVTQNIPFVSSIDFSTSSVELKTLVVQNGVITGVI